VHVRSKGLTRVVRNIRTYKYVFVDYSVSPCRRRVPLICAFRTRGFSSGWLARLLLPRLIVAPATCKLNTTLAAIEIDLSRTSITESRQVRGMPCSALFLHAWCRTDAMPPRQHLRMPTLSPLDLRCRSSPALILKLGLTDGNADKMPEIGFYLHGPFGLSHREFMLADAVDAFYAVVRG